MVSWSLVPSLGINIHIGNRFYANFDCCILDCARVDIGNNVLFGPGVHIYAATHPYDPGMRTVLSSSRLRTDGGLGSNKRKVSFLESYP